MKKTGRMARALARKSQEGVMLLEALVAILIFSLGIVALMGLQANSIIQVTQSKFRTDASYLANQILGKMWVDQANLPSYVNQGAPGRAQWDTVVAATLPQGNGNIAIQGRVVTVTITWRMPDDPQARRYVTVATLNETNTP